MKERINFEELCKDILASDYDEAIKQDTQEVLECVEHTHASRKGQAVIQITEQEISYRKNFLLWMNEEHFHPENYKPYGSRGLSLIKQSEMLEWFSKPFMIDFLQNVVHLVLCLDLLVLSKLEGKTLGMLKKYRSPSRGRRFKSSS